MDELVAWRRRKAKKPLLLYGARQTGKTWLMEEFGRREFDEVVKIDFMLDGLARGIFEQDLDPHRIIQAIELRAGRGIDPNRTLLILDEIQEAPRGITALKYFCERAPEYHVIAAGSYMGVSLRRTGESFPVGKVDTLTLHPLSFEEFLRAVAGNPLADALRRGDIEMLEVAADLLERHLKAYLVVGGMPEVVASYVSNGDLIGARHLQSQILAAYDADFSKHAPSRLLERMRLVWASLGGQLARENRKFVYGAVRPGARARDFEECIQWLIDYGTVHKVSRVSALRVPLAGYEDASAFKLFCVDVGLLGAMVDLDVRAVLEGSGLFTESKGAITEQYVEQELVAQGYTPVYWSSETGTAETDFVISRNGEPLPVEVKAGDNLRSKSMKVARDKFGFERGVRTSLAGYRDEGWLMNIPLWAIGAIDRLV